MDVTRLPNGPYSIETRPVDLGVLDSDEESEGEDAPPRANGTNGLDREIVEDDSEGESEDDWDIDSLIEDAIEELSDDQLLGGEFGYFETCCSRRHAKYSLQCQIVVHPKKGPSTEHYFVPLDLRNFVGKLSNVVRFRPRKC
jgi:hypothetical protein